MAEYYHEDDSQLRVFDLPFDVGLIQARGEWDMKARNLVDEISGYNHVVVFITTHSDPDTGDLWLGKDENNEPCAAEVGDVSTCLFYYFILILIMNSTVASDPSWPF